MELFKINKKLLPVKAHYFLVNGAHSGVITFIPVYAVQLGISSSAIGVIFAVVCCLTVISKPIFGGIVDHFQKLKQALVIFILIDVIADLGLNFIPRPHHTFRIISYDELLCHSGNLYAIVNNCGTNFTNSIGNCSSSCLLCEDGYSFCLDKNETVFEFEANRLGDNALKNATITRPQNLHSNTFMNKCMINDGPLVSHKCFQDSDYPIEKGSNPLLQLTLLSLFVGLIYLAMGTIVSLSDTACYNSLGDKPHEFGRQRLWGTIGWGSFAFLTGYLNQIFTGSSKFYNYSAGFYMLVILFAFDLLVVTKLQLSEVNVSKNIYKDVKSLLIKPKIILFILGMFGIGMLTGISRVYIYWYLRTTLGASQLVLGCLSGIQCFFGELPFFFFSGLIIQKLGHINTSTMSFLSYGLRFLVHSFLRDPWLALPVEFLQGPCFGSFYSAMTSYSKMIAPEGTEATMQGIVSGTFEGLGVATGSVIAGFCLSNFGNRATFFWLGIISMVVGIIHWFTHFIINYKKSN